MTEKEILELMEAGEGPSRVFLPANTRTHTLGQSLVALANAHGGQVFLGVRGRKRLSVEGVPAPDKARALILEAAQECVPSLDLPAPEMVSVQGRPVLVVEVPAGLHTAHHWRGIYYQRVGRENVPLSGVELRSLLLERAEEGFETLVAGEKISLDDLDEAQVKTYAELRQHAPADLAQLLKRCGCVRETPDGLRPTYAGLLLFAADPQAVLPQARILLARYPGTSANQEPLREIVRGTLPEQIRQAEAFLQNHMRRGRMWVDSERVEVTEYPLEAVREGIVNAVAHRDYSIRGDQIRVSMFLDRIEIYSPGRLPGPVTVDNILEQRFSRNPLIVRVLAEMGLIGQLGYGVDRMVSLMAEAHLPPPAFNETRAGFLLTLHGPSGVPIGDLPPEPEALARLGLNERQVQALLYVGEKGRISTREFQELCPEVSADTLRRDLADMVSRGLLLKVGERRATYHILK